MAQQDDYNNKTIFIAPGGNIETSVTLSGAHLNFTHPSGSNVQYADGITSTFNSGKSQSLTLSDSFNTVQGEASTFVKKRQENRVLGDSVDFVGPTVLITDDLQNAWYKEYMAGYGGLKSQWNDNRAELPISAYPVNTVYDIPTNSATLKQCPVLRDGTAEDNLDSETVNAFKATMMQVEGEADPSAQGTAAMQESLNALYSNKMANFESVYISKFGQK